MKARSLMAMLLALALAVSATALWAAGPQGDDFSGSTPKSFWKSADIGQQDGGSFSLQNGKLMLQGSGADIWGASFQFFYVYQEGITGDFSATVKVEKTPFPDAADGWSSVGILATTPAALDYVDGDATTIPAWVGMGLSNNNGAQLKWGAADVSGNATASAGLKPPAWVRLVRRGNTFSGYYSTDGVKFALVTSTTIPQATEPMKDPLLLGIFVQSHEANQLGDPVVDDFTVTPLNTDAADKTAPAAITDLEAAANGSDSASLSWTAPGGAFRYDVRSALVPITEANWDAATPVAAFVPDPGAAGTKETATVTGLDQIQAYYFAVKAEDANSNASALSNLVSATTGARPAANVPANGLLHEEFLGINGGTIGELRASGKFPNSPDVSDFITDFEVPVDHNDNFGQRVRGYLTAPETGDYVFNIASDDASELWLSTDENPANAKLIAGVASWTNSREWTKEEGQTSEPVHLTAGKKYYIEALEKDGTGGDNLAVMWTLPDGLTTEEPIPASRLTPFVVGSDFGRISGIITDGNQKPLQGAVLTFTTGDKSVSAPTGSDGFYTMLVPAGTGELVAAFPQPWNTNTLKADVTANKGQLVQQNFAFNLVKPPFKPASPDAAISDDFSGASLASKWTGIDIGTTEPGDAKVSGGTLTVTGDGADIWDGGDNFHYVYQTVSGDFEAVLHVLTVPTTDGWSKSGIMVRESDDPGSYHYFVAATRDNGIAAQGRVNEIGGTPPENVNVNGGTFTQNTGYWVKLIRQGQKLTALKSADGENYEFIAQIDSPGFTAGSAMLGVAVTSHLAGTTGDSIVDDFIVSKTIGQPTAGTAPPPAGKLGDFDRNDKVNILDVLTALRAAAGITPLTAEQQAVADVNSDGKFNITDVVFILRMAAGLITEFPKA